MMMHTDLELLGQQQKDAIVLPASAVCAYYAIQKTTFHSGGFDYDNELRYSRIKCEVTAPSAAAVTI